MGIWGTDALSFRPSQPMHPHTFCQRPHSAGVGGGSSTKTERREETGVGCGAHRDGELKRDDRPAFPIPAGEVSTVLCGKWAELSFLSSTP